MTIRLIRRVGAACLALAISAPAWAQDKPVAVDGNVWLQSAPDVRKAFIIGAGSMIAAESAYSKKKGSAPPVAGALVARAMDGLTLDQVSNRITRWYEANPGRRNMPVMGVIWIDMVRPAAGSATQK
jgi:hypothetical protein